MERPIRYGHKDNSRRDEPYERFPREIFELVAVDAPYSSSSQAIHSPCGGTPVSGRGGVGVSYPHPLSP